MWNQCAGDSFSMMLFSKSDIITDCIIVVSSPVRCHAKHKTYCQSIREKKVEVGNKLVIWLLSMLACNCRPPVSKLAFQNVSKGFYCVIRRAATVDVLYDTAPLIF